MESGHREGLTKDRKPAMKIVCYVEKRTRELTTCGEIALRSTSAQISVVTKDWTALPLSEHMKAEDQCHE
eukprot:308397-Heterocapsa_arctica.AAC.1